MAVENSPLSVAQRKYKPATDVTRQKNAAMQSNLPFENREDFENAQRGFIATLEPLTIAHSRGTGAAFDLSTMDFLKADAPDTVNPSLWR